jgi:two-component system, chemotaxis family, chemotaxis protein CheY
MLDRSNLKILIVDDSDFSRSVIRQMLLQEGLTQISEASNAHEAMLLISDKKPHVVITDIVMPEVSGIELTEQITQKFDDVAVIVISSLTQEHVVLEAISAGASDFLAKPIQQSQLIDTLDKILHEQGS